MTLPSVHKNSVSVRVSEKTVVVEEASRFKLFYSSTQEIIVTVSDSMAGKVCGACNKLVPLRDTMNFEQDTMQEYMAAFAAEDFPTW